jgi:hypothetical protein
VNKSAKVVLVSGASWKLHNTLPLAGLLTIRQQLNVLSPKLERGSLFRGIARSVVDARDTSFVAADVVDHSLDDVRLHAKFGHACSDCTPYTESLKS